MVRYSTVDSRYVELSGIVINRVMCNVSERKRHNSVLGVSILFLLDILCKYHFVFCVNAFQQTLVFINTVSVLYRIVIHEHLKSVNIFKCLIFYINWIKLPVCQYRQISRSAVVKQYLNLMLKSIYLFIFPFAVSSRTKIECAYENWLSEIFSANTVPWLSIGQYEH